MTIEEALAASEAEPVTDDDMQFWIDEHLRVISIPKNGVVAGVEGDKNVNKIKFGMNRYYHGFDMSELSGRILYSNAKGNKNYYNITDMQTNGNTITFSWLVDADAVQYMGKTAFVVYLFKIQGSELRQKFFSTLATLKVLEGMEVDSAVPVEKQTDIIERMKEEISAYAEEVKKSLPADYTAMTEQVNSLKEDLGGLENLKYRELYYNLFYDFFAIATNKSGNMTEYGNAQHIFVKNVYSNGVKLESGNYLVALKLTNISLKRQVNVDTRFALCIIDGWNKKYQGDIQYYNGEKELFAYSVINFTNDNNIKVSPALILDSGFEPNSEYSFDVDTIAIIKNNTNGLPESIFYYGNNKIYPVFE